MLQDLCQFELCGSYRRQRPILKDLDVVVMLSGSTQLIELESRIKLIGYIKSGGNANITCEIMGEQVDFKICYDKGAYPYHLMHFTGSKLENIRLRAKAHSFNWKLNEYGLWRGDLRYLLDTEEDIYLKLQEPFKKPWERE